MNNEGILLGKRMPKMPIFDDRFFKNFITFTAVDEIQQLMQPLEALGIDYFGYHVTYTDGFSFKLNNFPDWMRYYYQRHLFKIAPTHHKKAILQGVCLSEYMDLKYYFDEFAQFNLTPPLVIAKNQGHYTEHFHFTFKLNRSQSCASLLSSLDWLYHFIAYFKDRGQKLIARADQQRIYIPSYKFTHPSTRVLSPAETRAAKKLMSFIQQTSIKRFYLGPQFQNQYLTERELDIISLLIQGKNLATIGRQLCLSYKTIDDHVTHIKEKLDCQTLFEIGFKLGNIGQEWLVQRNLNWPLDDE